MTNTSNVMILNILGSLIGGVTGLSAGSEATTIFFPLTISLFMCLLAGVTNMLITEKEITSKTIILKILFSILIAFMVFFYCVANEKSWAFCGFWSGFFGWGGYPLFYGIEKIIERRLKKKAEDVL